MRTYKYNFRDEYNNPIPVSYLIDMVNKTNSFEEFLNRVRYGSTDENSTLDSLTENHLHEWYINNTVETTPFLTGHFLYPETPQDFMKRKEALDYSDLTYVANEDLGFFFLEDTKQFSSETEDRIQITLGVAGVNYDYKARF